MTRKARSAAHILAPVMDRALALVEERLPAAAADLEAELRQHGWTTVGMSLEGLATGAKLLGRRTDFRVVRIDPERKQGPRLAVRADQVEAAPAIADVAKKEVYFHGLATAERIERLVAAKFPGAVDAELVRQTLQLIDGFSWLDDRSGWFRIQGIGKHGLPKTIDKVLAVAGSLSIRQLRAAVGRNRRMWKEPPPEGVLLEFCRRHAGRADRRPADLLPIRPAIGATSLTGVEWKLVNVLKKHGPVMERGEMEDRCVARGHEPLQLPRLRLLVAGHRAAWAQRLRAAGHRGFAPRSSTPCWRRTARSGAVRRVLDSHGWTEDGKVWLSYRLSKAASTYAVITVPAALKKVVRGRFTLLAPDGAKIGALATKDGRAWGLGAFLRRHGAGSTITSS